jgi:parvulin-like peptidyl-prolyl isomerase
MGTPLLQVGEKVIHIHELPFLLRRYQVMSQVLRGIVIDSAIADISCTEEERLIALAQFEEQHQITLEESQLLWLKNRGITLEEMEDMVIRTLKIEKFKNITWGQKLESHFLACKASFDRVIYSLIRTKDEGLAYEIYFRIQEGEQSFSELAREYSQGTEAHTGGLLGPVSLTQPHPAISKLLSVSKPGQLWSPRSLADWFVIVRLEKFIPAKLDEAMRRHLMNELFENWVQEQLQEASPSIVA